MAMLVDDDKVAWMDCVTKHLPEFQLRDPWLAREVRIADLLSHRTGREDPDHSSGEFDRAELIRRARLVPQIAPFRSGCYSTTPACGPTAIRAESRMFRGDDGQVEYNIELSGR